MSTHDKSVRSRRYPRWVTPAVSVAMGVLYLVAGALGDNLGFGVFGLVLMTSAALAFVLVGRRSETVAGLMDRRDERINHLDQQATMFAGVVVLAAVLAMFLFEVARGEDGSPYYQLGALGGVAYVVSLGYLRFRR